ncbi:mannosyl-oligosaccharide alpha-1,2-mannosidase-like protein [Kalaharituber pfeilii]|nr:mannosyl-oligosaccharide alpha-1,2-mannosidase-like protein [Kalaharituber pfeilii]
MARFRPATRYRHRYLILAGVITTIFLYTYLSTDTLSAPIFETKYYPHTSWHKSARVSSQAGYQIQFDFKSKGVPAGDAKKADAVVQAMRRTFWKYKLKAWGRDEVKPITGESQNTRNGWAATIVDTLTTTALMRLEEEFLLELNYTLHIDFTETSDLVDPFETTIRYLGALVSTIDMIDEGVIRRGLVQPSQRDGLLEQAVILANRLGPSYDSPTGMIWPRVNFTSGKGCIELDEEKPYPNFDHPTIGPARAGSNYLENKVLSKLTGDVIYLRNATRAWAPLVWNKNAEDMPGLVNSPIDILTGVAIEKHRSWGAGHDSYYEYLIKASILSPRDRHSAKYKDRWIQAVESTMKYLAVRGSPPEGQTQGKLFLSQWKNGWLLNEMGHLACFAGGNFLLGGKYLNREDIIQLGLDIVDACHHTYVTSTTRVGPENFAWIPEPPLQPTYQPEGEGQRRQLREKGFWISDARWMLRPETVESYFYAYRITGNRTYQDWAWDAFSAMINASTAEFGYAEIGDVTHPAGPQNQNDKSESFWGAETLKYLYLIFTDEEMGNLDKWVFSTEAHPFRIIN